MSTIIERDGQQYLVEEIVTKRGTVVVETLYNPNPVPIEPPQPTPEQLEINDLKQRLATAEAAILDLIMAP